MNSRNVISPIELERLEDLSGQVLRLWELDEQPPGSAPTMPWSPLEGFRADQLQAPLQGASTFTVVCTSRRPRLVDDFVDWATRLAEARTYLVGPEEWAGSPQGQALLKQGRPGLLVRLGAEPPGDWILADQGRSGWLMVGPPGAPRSWVLPLDAALARSLYEATTLLFWHHTTREAVPEPHKPARFVACLPSPFAPPDSHSVPLPHGGLLLRDGAEAPLLPNAEVTVAPEGVGIEGAPRLLVTPPAMETFDRMAALTDQGIQVVWFDQQLPRLAVSRERMVLALEEGVSRIHLHFNAQEAIRTLQALDRCASRGAWRFHARRALREVRGQVRTAGAPEARKVHDEVQRDLGDITANELASFDQTTPTGWPPAAELARQVRYRWRVVPPRPPAGHRPAQLCHQWSALDEFVARRVEQLRARMDKVEREEQEEGLLSRLAGLLSRWTNVRSQRKRLKQAVDEIAEQKLSKRPEEAQVLLQRLAEHEEALARLEGDCRRQVEEEERRVEEERQRKDHEAQVAQASARRDGVLARLAALRQELDSKRAELGAAKAEADQYAVDLERFRHEEQVLQARARLEEIQTQLSRDDARAESIRAQLDSPRAEQGAASSKEERKQSKKELHTLDERRKQLEREAEQTRRRIETPFTPALTRPLSNPDVRLQELLARQKRLGEGVGALEKQVSALEQERASCEQVIDKPFQFQFVPHPGPAAWKPPAFRPPPIPDEALPETGVLLEHGGRRYLAITHWLQVARAQPIAVRLKAQLVALDAAP
jgi:predicted  nucleic acid-binding Zn-ribbon protein